MKNMKRFMIGTLLLFVCLLVFTQYQYHTMSFALIDETGDSSALQGVTLQTQVQYKKSVLFDVAIQNGNVAYQQSRYAKEAHQDILLTIGADTKQIVTEERKSDVVEESGFTCTSSGECEPSICTIEAFEQDEGKLYMRIHTNLYNVSGEARNIEMDVMLHADDHRQILHHQTSCDALMDESLTKPIHEQITPALPYQLIKKDTEYYLMMQIDPHMEGIMNIYQFHLQMDELKQRMQVKDVKSVYEIPIQLGTTGFLTTYEDQNYVFVWADEVVQIMTFDKAMTLVDTVKTSMPLHAMEEMTFYRNDQYVLIKQGNTIVCYDVAAKAFIDSITLTKDTGIIHDILYKNGQFYVSSQQEVAPTGDAVFAQQKDAHIQIFAQGTLMYQGTLSLYDRFCENTGDACITHYVNKPLQFVRDAS